MKKQKQKVGRPCSSNSGKPRIHRVSLRITDSARNAVMRLIQNDNLNNAINDLLENLDTNLVYISKDEQQLLEYGLNIQDSVSYYSSIILNDLEESKENIRSKDEELITMTNEYYSNVDNW